MNSRKKKTVEYEFLSTVLILQFKQFSLALDKLIEKTTMAALPLGSQDESSTSPAEFAELVSAVIAEIRRICQWVIARHPELSNETIHDFQFLMGAWADEAMIKIGQDRLSVEQRGNVEKGLFGTVFAGEEFFLRVEKIVSRRSGDDICLGGAYLLALIMGFEGRYIGGAGVKELRRNADKLQSISVRKIAVDHLVGHDIEGSPGQGLSIHRGFSFFEVRPKLLAALFAALLVVTLMALELHWSSATNSLVRVLQDMSDMHKPLTEDKAQLQ